MKTYICKVAAIAAIATLGNVAHAESPMEVFGLVDLSLKSVSTGGVTVNQMAFDGMQNSRLGFRGEEDLGDGMKAGAWLEMSFNPDNGTLGYSPKLFHRRSTVSLSSGLGELRLGRDLDPTFYNLAVFDPFSAVGVGASFNVVTALGSGAPTLLRADNAVSYFLPPDLGGLYGQVQVALDGGIPANRYDGARFGYQRGPWNLSIASATTGTATADSFRLTNAGVSYDAGFAKFMVLFNGQKYGALKQNNWELGVTAPVSAAGYVRASYLRAEASGMGTDGNGAKQLALGYVYNLSKHTSLYGTVSQLRNSGLAAYVVGTPPAAVPGGTSKGVELGIMHAF